MCCGAYDADGAGPLSICGKGAKIASTTFSQIVKDDILPFFMDRQKTVGLFDNAPSHVGGSTLGVLLELGIVRSRQPPRSPDLNPIELVWNRMAMRVNRALPWGETITREQVIAEIKKAWELEATASCFEKDMLHVCEIMHKVIHAEGGNMF